MRHTDQNLEQARYHQRRILKAAAGTLICLGGILIIAIRPEALEAGLLLVVLGAGIVDPATLSNMTRRGK